MAYMHLNEPLKALAYPGRTPVWEKRDATQNGSCAIKHTVHNSAQILLKTDLLKFFNYRYSHNPSLAIYNIALIYVSAKLVANFPERKA